MKLLFVLLFLSAIVTNELLIGALLPDEFEISLCDNPTDGSEEEKKDSSEEESEIDYFILINDIQVNQGTSFLNHSSAISYPTVPFRELHSPPPEFFLTT